MMKEPKLSVDISVCKSCVYWRQLRSGGNVSSTHLSGLYACHYILDNGMRRKRDGEECLSYQKRTARPRSSRRVALSL